MFTMRQMKRAYDQHANLLVMILQDGSVCSANPDDYWEFGDDHVFNGYLAKRIPERFERLDMEKLR